MKIWAFIPAGGTGSRMGLDTPKQYLKIGGKEIVRHAVERLSGHRRVSAVVIGVAPDDAWFSSLDALPVHAVTLAGSERARTVANGLSAMLEFAAPDDWVMVHDAARPLVRAADIDRLVEAAEGGRDGALLAVPVTDTVKRADGEGRAEATIERSRLWRAATPQLFPLALLSDSLATAFEAGATITDEASAMEHAGYRPKLVACGADNIKITTLEDLELAEWFLARQEETE